LHEISNGNKNFQIKLELVKLELKLVKIGIGKIGIEIDKKWNWKN
jgi:hypothetical protein